MKHLNASHGYRPVHRAKLLRIAPLTPQANHGTVSVSAPLAPVIGFHRVLAARCGFPFRLRRVLRSALLSATALVAVAAPGWADETIDGGDPVIVDGRGLEGAGGTGTQPNPWNTGGILVVGQSSTGGLKIIAGGSVTNTYGAIGRSSGATGTVTVTGAGSRWTNTGNIPVVVGDSGTGTLTIAEGGAVSSADGTIGKGTNARSTASVTGTGSIWTNTGNLKVGADGTGTLTIADSAVVQASKVNVARVGMSSGTLNIGAAAGDTAVAAGTLTASTVVFGTGTGKLVFNHTDTDYTFAAAINGAGSVNVLSGTTKLTGSNTYSGGTTISGGTLQIGNGGTSGSLSGDVTNNGALAFNRSGALTYGDDISGTGSLTKSGTGTLTLTGTSSFTGDTTISGGTLTIAEGGTVSNDDGTIGKNEDTTGKVTVTGEDSSWTNTGDLTVGYYG
ncbi:autotransporter-associated beta strand repeat-containing protein/T5SS/PEP-CTERM-associated repeat-containing protein, partial [Sulfitobacter marinus]